MKRVKEQEVKILMVDDRTENLFALEILLANQNYVCIKASSGTEALEVCETEKDFALILMDVQMPVMDGFETVELIKKIVPLTHVPVIFLTASLDDTVNVFKGYEAGAVDYMIKPLSPEILRAKVAVFVDLYSKTRELLEQREEMEKLNNIITTANQELILQNEEKEKRADELGVINKNLTAFTYISSHDLQEPLRKISNFISILSEREDKNLSVSGKEYLQKTADTAKRMRLLIDDLLLYSRAGNLESNFEKTDLNILFRDIVNENEDLLKEKNAVINIAALTMANIIPSQFRQLFQNLISNAIKFSLAKTETLINIKCKIINGKGSTLKLSPKLNYLKISVSDNGIGFEPRFNEKIFEVFQRLHGQGEYTGTGMGLAICKRIVENHKGIIMANGILNEGATFDVYIPSV